MAKEQDTMKAYREYRKAIGSDSEAMHPLHFAEVNKLPEPKMASSTDKTVGELRKSGVTWKEICSLMGSGQR
jgi:hypothetical protein